MLFKKAKTMLKNETYAGVRYFNRITKATEANREGNKLLRGKWILRVRCINCHHHRNVVLNIGRLAVSQCVELVLQKRRNPLM